MGKLTGSAPIGNCPPGMMPVTPTVFATPARFREWFCGMRPLPDMDDEASRFYFMSQVHAGGLTELEALERLERHRRLTAVENGEPDGLPEVLIEQLIRLGWTPPRGQT